MKFTHSPIPFVALLFIILAIPFSITWMPEKTVEPSYEYVIEVNHLDHNPHKSSEASRTAILEDDLIDNEQEAQAAVEYSFEFAYQ